MNDIIKAIENEQLKSDITDRTVELARHLQLENFQTV